MSFKKFYVILKNDAVVLKHCKRATFIPFCASKHLFGDTNTKQLTNPIDYFHLYPVLFYENPIFPKGVFPSFYLHCLNPKRCLELRDRLQLCFWIKNCHICEKVFRYSFIYCSVWYFYKHRFWVRDTECGGKLRSYFYKGLQSRQSNSIYKKRNILNWN